MMLKNSMREIEIILFNKNNNHNGTVVIVATAISGRIGRLASHANKAPMTNPVHGIRGPVIHCCHVINLKTMNAFDYYYSINNA
ncbi:hypothetical protein BpHYR1_048397 [Brachionus plicatilis]|uniref:Uncharacterized protein n=1 Tax=Brachionus plicatilis TaxID=10195 RepID=A0A3M7SZX3_BRAPC|nr:hypothetical protein BpHYR1_048397 [Brachionus plicatilis]